MERITVLINGEIWECYNNNNQLGGISKRDKNYLQKVVTALNKALEQAQFELNSASNESDTIFDIRSAAS